MSKARLRLQSPTVPHFGHPLNPPKNLPLEDDLNAEFCLDQLTIQISKENNHTNIALYKTDYPELHCKRDTLILSVKIFSPVKMSPHQRWGFILALPVYVNPNGCFLKECRCIILAASS